MTLARSRTLKFIGTALQKLLTWLNKLGDRVVKKTYPGILAQWTQMHLQALFVDYKVEHEEITRKTQCVYTLGFRAILYLER